MNYNWGKWVSEPMKAFRVISILILTGLIVQFFTPLIAISNETSNPQTAPTAQARGVDYFLYDFGTASSPLAPNAVRVPGSTVYGSGTSYGFNSVQQDFNVRGAPREIYNNVLTREWVYDTYVTPLSMDGVRNSTFLTFKTDIPNGTYRVKLYLGDLINEVYSINVSIQGEWVAEEQSAFHIVHRSMYMDPNYGWVFPLNLEAEVTAGTLNVTLAGNDTAYWTRLAEEQSKPSPKSFPHWMSTGGTKTLTPHPPYRYIGGPLTNVSLLAIEIYKYPYFPVTTNGNLLVLDPGITTQELQDAVTSYNSGNHALAYGHWNQSLSLSLNTTCTLARAQLGLYLAGSLKIDTELITLPSALDDLQTVLVSEPENYGARELLNITERMLQAFEYMFQRIELGKNHFLENDKGIMLLWTINSTDPIYPKARLWLARALFMLDPHRWVSSGGTAYDILNYLETLEPENPYIKFFLHTDYRDPRVYELGTEVISTTGENDVWDLVDYNQGWGSAPQWAQDFHLELNWLYDIADWWVDHRQQPAGNLGGGWSDDVEFIGLFGYDALISDGADPKGLEGARKFVEGMLASGGVDMDKGYCSALADAEHTAEWTGDSLPMMIAVDYGNPYWLEFSMKTAALMEELWMGATDLNHFHFRSNYLSATKIGGANTREDAWINYRAVLPAKWVWWYNNDPEIGKLFVDWATAWVEDAMRTDKSKPAGIIPASIGFEGDEIGGHNAPNWYQAQHPAGSVNYDWAPQQYKIYITSLITSAYEATGNLTLLEPFRLEAEIAQAYLDNPIPNPTPGSYEWAGKTLGQKAVDLWTEIQNKYDLPGAPGGTATYYTRNDVVSMLKNGLGYIDKCYPLLTTEASATDRVAFIGCINPFMLATGGGVGGALLEPQVTYTDLQRDFAAFVPSADPDGFTSILYGFYAGTRTVGVVPWALELGGNYSISVGPDANADNIPDNIEFTQEFHMASRGQAIEFPMEGGKEYAVVVEQLVAGTGVQELLPDLAVVETELWYDAANFTINAQIHNIGAAVAQNVTLRLFDGESPNGTPVGDGVLEYLAPPLNFTPSVSNVSVLLTGIPHTGNVTLMIDPDAEVQEITRINNFATVAGVNITDDVPPVIEVVQVQPDTPYSGEQITVNVTVIDNHYVSSVWFNLSEHMNWTLTRLNSSDLSKHNFTLNFTSNSTGDFAFDVYAYDVIGNSATTSGGLKISEPPDLEPPELFNLSIHQLRFLEWANVSIAVNDARGVFEVWIDVINVSNNTMEFDAASARYYKNSSYTPGTYNFTISARDLAGNWNLTHGEFTVEKLSWVDQEPPVITNLTITSAHYFHPDYSVNVSVNVQDNYGVELVWLRFLEEGGWDYLIVGNLTMSHDSETDRYYFNHTYTRSRPYEFNIFAIDIVGNIANISGYFEIYHIHDFDYVPPIIVDIDYPTTTYTNESITIRVKATDNRGIHSIQLILDGSEFYFLEYNKSSGFYEYTMSFDTAGKYNITIWAEDNGSNNASEFIIINVLDRPEDEPKEPPPEDDEDESDDNLGWIIGLSVLLIVIIIVIVIVLLMLRRRPMAEAEYGGEDEEE